MQLLADKVKADQVLKKIEELPTLPTVIYEVMRALNNPMASVGQVTEVVGKDQALTLKVLKMASSSFYAIPGGATTLNKAVTFLGFNTVYQLMVSSAVIDQLRVRSSIDFDVREFWTHSFGCALAAEYIAKKLNSVEPEIYFLGGLVHDVGKLILFIHAPEDWRELCREARIRDKTVHEIETKQNLFGHVYFGGELAQRWKLPPAIQSVINYHHEPDLHKRRIAADEFNHYIDVVLLANALVHALSFGYSGYSIVPTLPKSAIDRLLINQDELPALIQEIKLHLENARSLLKVFLEAGE